MLYRYQWFWWWQKRKSKMIIKHHQYKRQKWSKREVGWVLVWEKKISQTQRLKSKET